MKNNKILLRVSVINVICFFVGVYFYYLPTVYSQEAAFLSPPYFGSTTVNAIFDHEYPLYGDENGIGFNGNIDTMVHRTNERLANLPGVIDANRYCVGYSGHDGIDYNLRYQYVLSSHAGTVVEATWDDAANHRLNLGLQVTLQTDEAQYRTIYGHLSTVLVEAGQQIDTETVLGISGSTGNSSGPHLHFTLQRSNNAQLPTYTDVNPYGWGSIETDPWTEDPPVRPASEVMWAHYPAIQNRNLGGNFPCTAQTIPYDSGTELELSDSQDPRLIPDLTAATTYILDDSDDEFTAIGIWQTETCAAATDCYEGEWHHTITSGITAIWQPAAGNLYDQEYDLYAYIPEGATTTQASYRINHNSTSHWAGIRQMGFSTTQRWAYIGRYEFNGNGNEYVQLTSMNEDGTEVTGADALAFVLVGDPPPPPPTDTPIPTDTPETPEPIETPPPTPLPPSDAYMTKISTGSGGKNPVISSNGRYVAYYNNTGDIMRYDHATKQTEMVVDSSFGFENSIAISADGNYIAYVAPGPYRDDVFLYDHNADLGELPQNLTNHQQNSTITGIQYWDIKIAQPEGSVLVGFTERIYFSGGSNSQTIWLYNSAQGIPPTATAVDPGIGSLRYLHDISADGNELLVRNEQALYVYTLVPAPGHLERVFPLPNPQGMGGADFSSDARFVVYNSYSIIYPPFRYIRDVYWYDRNPPADDPEKIFSDASGSMSNNYPRVSDDGRYVFYMTGLEIRRYDRDGDSENQITVTIDGGNVLWGTVDGLEISSNGRFAVFSSTASNLVANDTNDAEDVFLADTALLTDPPTPTATPSNPNPTPTPTPKPKIICWFLTILASNDLGNSGIARQDGINNSSAPASANESLFKQGRQFLGKMMQTADMLTLLYRLRDDVMSQTETGLYYTDLYYTHTEELTDIVEADPALFQEAHNTVLLFQPHLEDFLDGDGNSITVTAAEVQAVQSLLDQFAALGSPALQQTIATEQARWPLAQFIGKTSNEVWDIVSPPQVPTSTPTPTATNTPAAVAPIRINFQANSAAVPDGYLVDNGSVFASRGNGLTYGWDIKITTTTRDRNSSLSPDQRYDTLVQPQDSKLPSDAIWEIALPNGAYEIHFVAGDPSYFDSYYHVLAEGNTLINAAPSSATRWYENSIVVTVNDGRLSITNGVNATNNKFNFIDITALSGSTATPVATSTGTATATSTGTATATATGTSTATATGTSVTTATSTSTAMATGTPTPTVMPTSTLTPTPMATNTPVGTASAPIHINFQANSVPVPNGYLVDNGSVFASRSSGLTYGWDIKITTTTRDRNNNLSPDQRYDTLVQPQDSNLPSDATWEIALPNGAYEIHFVAGDPSYFDSYYHMLAEGNTLINAAPSSAYRWYENTLVVTVSDGRLSITNGANANNNKFNFIDIVPLSGSTGTSAATAQPFNQAISLWGW